MNMPTLVICIVLAVLFFLAIRSIIRQKKSGGCGCGCEGCKKGCDTRNLN